MSRASVLARGRAAAAAGMIDACTVEHPTGVTTNDTTGVVTPTWSTVYTGPCRIKQQGNGSAADGGEVTVAVLALEVHVPIVGSETVVHGDRVTITSAVNDPALVGRTFQVVAKPIASERTARRLSCEEVD